MAARAPLPIKFAAAEKHTSRVSWRKMTSIIAKRKYFLTMQRLSNYMDWSPFLRQTVKTHFSLNGELSHGIVTQAVHTGV
jgi:hypothetical protein